MGSFSVACGMSKIPITGGEKVIFLPLKKNRYLNEIPLEHFFCYQTDLYEPALFPIEGEYDTYGSIENIVKNEHTAYLEKRYNVSIEGIVDTITNNRDIFSNYCQDSIWGITIFKENSLETFNSLGFSLIEENDISFLFLKKHNLKLIAEDKFYISDNYTLIYNDSSFSFNFKHLENFQSFVYEKTGVILGLKDEKNYKPLKELLNMGGQFFLKSVFDKMSSISFSEYRNEKILEKENSVLNNRISKEHLLALGFVIKDESYILEDKCVISNLSNFDCVLTIKNKSKKIYLLKDLFNLLNKKEILLDIEKIKNLTYMKIKFKNLIDSSKEDYKELKEAIERTTDEKHIEALKRMMDRSFNVSLTRDVFSNQDYFVDAYMEYFINLAETFDIQKEEEILNLYESFRGFHGSMSATNSLYIPSYCGYQCGARHVSKYLANLTLQILKENL